MPFFLSPIGNSSQVDLNGRPLAGGMIYTYLAGTDTPAPTYADGMGAAFQTNPIILNSIGLPANPIWLNGGQNYKFVITNAAGVLQRTVDRISGINDASYTPSEFIDFPGTPSYVSPTAFSVPGDQTSIFGPGRRLIIVNPSGGITSSVSSSSYGGQFTTVGVVNDSTPLAPGLSKVSYALITGNSVPAGATGRELLNAATPAAARGTLSVPSLSAFASQLASPGWKRSPDGTIEQWGQSSTGSDGRAEVTYPLAFPNALLWSSATLIVTQVNAPFITGTNAGTLTGIVLNACTTGGAGVAVALRWRVCGY